METQVKTSMSSKDPSPGAEEKDTESSEAICSSSFHCLLCLQEFNNLIPEKTEKLVSQYNYLTPSNFPIFRKVPKKILQSALENGHYCINCTETLDQIHNFQETIRQLQGQLEELKSNLSIMMQEKYGSLENSPLIHEEAKDVNELRSYLYRISSTSKKSKRSKRSITKEENHVITRSKDTKERKADDETVAQDGDNVQHLQEATLDIKPDNKYQRKVIIQDPESEQHHTRLRSGSRLRKRTIKLIETEKESRKIKTRKRNTEKLACSHEGCDKMFYSEGLLFVHKRKDHEGMDDPMKCMYCDKVFDKSTQLLIHHRSHTGESPFCCTMCDAKFKAKWYLQQHMKLHVGPNVCTECGKRCASRQALEMHAISHTEDRPFVCDICGISYKSNQYLLNHQANQHAGVTNRPPIKCPTCLKLFSSASALRCHRLSAHGEGTSQFTCDACGSVWNSQREHDKHYNVVHLDIKTVECSECPKKFSNRSNLRIHIVRHHSTKEERPRPFQCETCGKAFHLKATLENHIKIHSGQTPFPCTQCDKRFPSKSYLDLHIYTIHENRKRKTQAPEGHQAKIKKTKESFPRKKRSSGPRKVKVITEEIHHPIYTLQPIIEENVPEIGAHTEIITLTPVSTAGGILNLISADRFGANSNITVAHGEAQNVVSFSYL